MATEITAPPYRVIPIIPALKPGVMAETKSFVANEKIQEAIGFPGKLVDDWHDRTIAKMGELLTKYRSLKVFLDACVHCGACS
ncbi:MAG: (Fe-S)-binding protein, partial [Gallionellaceae bacterium]|nr:(Fe-S)-binding protein [Gallionellaceae bacterium]